MKVLRKLPKSSELECQAIPASYAFGRFRHDAKGTLFRDTEPVALSRRAVALLRALLDRAGAPVSKDAVMEAAWPHLAVEESKDQCCCLCAMRPLRVETCRTHPVFSISMPSP